MRNILISALLLVLLAGCTNSAAPYEPQSTGTTDEGDVHIMLAPQENAGGMLRVAISADTHSVDLSRFDLAAITTIEFNGKTTRPISAPALSGHHASGALVFDIGDVETYRITIVGIPKTQLREYAWRNHQ